MDTWAGVSWSVFDEATIEWSRLIPFRNCSGFFFFYVMASFPWLRDDCTRHISLVLIMRRMSHIMYDFSWASLNFHGVGLWLDLFTKYCLSIVLTRGVGLPPPSLKYPRRSEGFRYQLIASEKRTPLPIFLLAEGTCTECTASEMDRSSGGRRGPIYPSARPSLRTGPRTLRNRYTQLLVYCNMR